ncbi:MAG: hypothetical protein M5U28_26935 [Sandaracinaceae bacterium]|nr:hypothetical protein [Sandaracinaceae bacterium]
MCALAVLALACGEEQSAGPGAGAADPAEEAPEVAHAPAAPPPARLRDLTGLVTLDGAAAERGASIDAEESVEVPAEGRAVVQLADGGRVNLEGGSLGRVVTETAAQLLLIRGAVHAVQPPAGSSPRPPLRVVTPTATVEIGVSGEVYVAVFEGGASWVVVLGGGAAVSNGEADARRRLRTVELAAGQAVAVAGRIAEPTPAPRRLSEAREAARALAGPPEGSEVERLPREIEAEAERLDQALRWLETETRRGRELTTQHNAAVRGGDREEAQRLQRQLVDHSQALYRLRQLATARWERLRTLWLRFGSLGPLPAADPVAQRRERVVGLLGL